MANVARVVDYLLSAQAIRDRTGYLFELACQDQLSYFRCDLSYLDKVAEYVLAVIQEAYPTGAIPVHSRWRHFEYQGQSQLVRLGTGWQRLPALERTRAQLDLVIVSVLLDAGAGARWQYIDEYSGARLRRSEGLAIASLQAFARGLFSSNPDNPWQVDAQGLCQLTVEQLAAAFQVTDDNPLVGLTGRWQLLQKLGQVLSRQPDFFGPAPARPGGLSDYFMTQTIRGTLPTTQILKTILLTFGEIWPGRVAIAGINLGDVWPHPALPDQGPGSQLVPFHKLSQWLTYSLLEPLEASGIVITEIDALTGLAEYRNGGLCLDLGLLQAKYPALQQQAYSPDSAVVVEWRALTVIALDRIANCIRAQQGLDAQTLPLPKILQGGTWAAGRRIAQEKRPGGTPPLQIISDGTVF
jgi:hypothetical protein